MGYRPLRISTKSLRAGDRSSRIVEGWHGTSHARNYSKRARKTTCLDFPKPPMRQCLVRCEPLRGIKIRQSTNKIFEICINARPQRDRLTRVILVEAVPNNSEDLAPRTLPKMLQEHIQSVLVRKIRYLALQDDS